MPLKRVAPPMETLSALESAAARRAAWRGGYAPTAEATTEDTGPPERLQVESLPQYTLWVTAIGEGVPLDAVAEREAWYCLVTPGGDVEAAAVAETGGAHRVLRWNRGPFNAQLQTVTSRIEEADELKGVEYEPRLLVVPGLCVYALWLWARSGSLVVPLSPTDPALVPFRLYTAGTFMAVLAEPALRRRAAKDSA